MAHHGSTPKSILDAPKLTPTVVWDPRRRVQVGKRRLFRAPELITLGTFHGSAIALVGDPRAAKNAMRRKRRAAANKAAKRQAQADERDLRRTPAEETVARMDQLTQEEHRTGIAAARARRAGDSYTGRGA